MSTDVELNLSQCKF